MLHLETFGAVAHPLQTIRIDAEAVPLPVTEATFFEVAPFFTFGNLGQRRRDAGSTKAQERGSGNRLATIAASRLLTLIEVRQALGITDRVTKEARHIPASLTAEHVEPCSGVEPPALNFSMQVLHSLDRIADRFPIGQLAVVDAYIAQREAKLIDESRII